MYHLFQKYLTGVIGLFFCLGAFAQSRVTGYVLNATGDTLSFATVKLKSDSTSSITKKYAIASANGYYSIIIPPGMTGFFLEASVVGYQTQIIPVKKIAEEDRWVDFKLMALSHTLEGVFIKSEPAITISGDTISFKADSFKIGNEKNISRLLGNIPGFVIQSDGRVFFNGEPITKVLIENSDLTGSNYQLIINNLAATGIDKIQVFKRYADPENINSQITTINQQVLNLKFKKGFLGKIFGKAEADVGYPVKYYDISGQFISLFANSKIISFGDANTLGKINWEENESRGASNPASTDISEVESSANIPLSTIADLKNSNLNTSPGVFNHSFFNSSNYYFKVGKKLIIKGTTGYFKDIYKQYVDLVSAFLLYPQSITTFQKQTVKKRYDQFYQSLSANWVLNDRNQLVLALNMKEGNYRNGGNEMLQGNPYQEGQSGNNNQENMKITYNHIFNRRSLFTAKLVRQSNRIPNLYTLSPPNFDTLFYNPDIYQSLSQDEFQRFYSTQSVLSFLKKYNRHTLEVTVGMVDKIQELENGIMAYTGTSYLTVNPDSTNNFRLKEFETYGKIQETWKWGKSLDISLRVEVSHLSAKRESKFSVQPKNSFNVLPELSAKIQVSRLSQFSILYSMQRYVLPLQIMGGGYIINGLSSVMKGDGSFRSGVTQSLQVFFSHVDLVDKEFLFFTGIYYQKKPLLVLTDQYPNAFYTLVRYMNTDESRGVVSVFCNAEKYFGQMKYKIAPQVSYTKGESLGYIDAKRVVVPFSQWKIALDLGLNLQKIKLKGRTNFSVMDQHSPGNTSQKSINTMKVDNSLLFNFKISQRLFIDLDVNYDLVYPPDQPKATYFICNSQFSVHSKNEKNEWGVKCNNIFNQEFYTYSFISPSEISYVRYKLLPRDILLYFQIKF